MRVERVKKELENLYEMEQRVLLAMANVEGSEDDQIFVCSKLFEIATYITELENYLESEARRR